MSIASDVTPTRSHNVLQALASGASSLRHRNFRLFFFGQLISLIGTWMQVLGQQWLVYSLTHSAFQLGVVSTFQFLPVLILSLFAGVIVERLPKRRLIVVTQILFLLLAGVLGVLVLTGAVQLWQVYVIAALYGVVNAFDVPARQAFMVEMVGREDLMNGIALNSSVFNASRIFGPALAALLIKGVGIAMCFILNAASFVPVIVGLLMMQLVAASRPATTQRQRPLRQIAEGLNYILQNERIWLVFAIVSVNNIFGIAMYATLLPIFATQVLRADVNALGEMSVALGCGATVGALVLAYLKAGAARSQVLLAAALAIGVLLVAFGLSHTLLLSLLLLAGIGFCVVSINSAGNAIIQEATPNFLRGRVMSVWGLVLIGFTPIGSFIAGVIADRFSAPFAVALGGVVCLAAAIYANSRARRHQSLYSAPAAEPLFEPALD